MVLKISRGEFNVMDSSKGTRMKTLFLKGTLSCGGGGGDSPPPPAPSDSTAPSVPASLIVNVISAGQMNLSWNVSTDNRGVTGYKIYRNGAYLTTVTSNSRSDMGLAKNISYCYRVSAVDAAGNESGQSTQACATTLDSWTKQWGSAADDEARGIVTDSSGNIYVTGLSRGNIDGQANAGDADAFLTKCDATGVRQWTKYIGTSGTDWGQAVDVDSAGNIYVTGSVSGSFDSKPYNGGTDVFLAKYGSNGNRIWYQQWGNAGNNFGYGVRVDASDTFVYVTGPTYEYLPTETGDLVPNIFLSKRSTSDGSASWTILDGTLNQSDYVEGIAMDSSGNVYLTGYTTGAFPTYTNNATYDIFLAQYNTLGTRQWVRQWGSTSNDYSYGVAVDGNDIYVTGSAGGSIDGQTNSGSDDIFLTKFDLSGNKQWTKLFGTSDLDRAYGITIDNSNNIYLTGKTLGSLGGGTNLGQDDVFLMKYDSVLDQVSWTKLLGTSAVDVGTGATFNISDGYIYVTGNTSGNLDGNINSGGEDVFLLKYNSSGVKQ
jgi:hypothetical protein